MTNNRERAQRIAALNDALRKAPGDPALGLLTMTSGVAALGSAFWITVLAKLASLEPNDYGPGNDPYGERDFSVFEVDGHKCYGKIDYFERGGNFTAGAEHPENADTTERVLTVMLREEY